MAKVDGARKHINGNNISIVEMDHEVPSDAEEIKERPTITDITYVMTYNGWKEADFTADNTPAGTEGLTEITDDPTDIESVEVKRLIDLGGNTVGEGTGWEVSYTGYPVTAPRPDGYKPDEELPLLYPTGAPFFALIMEEIGGKLYLFTAHCTSQSPFTFDLLFVKTVKVNNEDVKYSFTVNASSIEYYQDGSSQYNGNITPDGVAGDRLWEVYPDLATEAIASLRKLEAGETVDIYMIVHRYADYTMSDSDKNVIRIK